MPLVDWYVAKPNVKVNIGYRIILQLLLRKQSVRIRVGVKRTKIQSTGASSIHERRSNYSDSTKGEKFLH